MLNSVEIEQKIRTVKPVLKEKFFVHRIGLFGSFVTGDQTDASDIDILVEFSKPLGWEFFDLKELLETELQQPVDLVSVKALKPQLRDIILKQVKYV